MEPRHQVIDTDIHFKIDPKTRTITNTDYVNTTLVQNDHNSERFTFELPRYVDGHDMLESTAIEVHYINAENKPRNPLTHSDIYEVTDITQHPENEELVIFSWLVSNLATQYIGNLKFAIRFICAAENEINYIWSTASINVLKVIATINNTKEVITPETSDILNQWREELFNLKDTVVNEISDDVFSNKVDSKQRKEDCGKFMGIDNKGHVVPMKETYGEKLIAEYIHQGNQEIHFIEFDYETGIGTTAKPHGLTKNTKVMIVPNQITYPSGYQLNEGAKYIPYEWIKYNKDIYLSVIDDTHLKVINSDQQIMKVNFSDLPTNENVNITQFHFEIPVGWKVDNLKTSSKKFRVTQFGYIKSFVYRYIQYWGKKVNSKIPNEYLAYSMNYLGIPHNYHISTVYQGILTYQNVLFDFSLPWLNYYSRDNIYLGRRYGEGNYNDIGREKDNHIYKTDSNIDYISGFGVSPIYAHMANNTVIRIYEISEESNNG